MIFNSIPILTEKVLPHTSEYMDFLIKNLIRHCRQMAEMVRAMVAREDDGLPLECGCEYEYPCLNLKLCVSYTHPIIWDDLGSDGAITVV